MADKNTVKVEGLSGVIEGLAKVVKEGEKNNKTLGQKFTAGFKENYEKLQKQANITGNLKEGLGQDLDKFKMMLGPLEAIPGMNTALAMIKSTMAKLLVTSIGLLRSEQRKEAFEAMKFKWDKAKRRAADLAKGTKDILKNIVKHPVKSFGLILMGAVTAFGVAIMGFVSGLASSFSKMFGFFGFKKLSTFFDKASIKSWERAQKMIDAFITRFRSFAGLMGNFSKGSKVLQPIIKGVTKTLGFIGKFASILGKLFWPIQIVMTLWEGLKGGMEGFKKYEGDGIINQIFGGLLGFISGVASFLIGWPLDMLKSAVAWIGDKLGFDMSFLEEFSFQDLIGGLGTYIYDWILGSIQFIKDLWNNIDIMGYLSGLVDRAMNTLKLVWEKIASFPKAVGAGSAAAVGALLPGGESPIEAFNRAYNESMAGSDAKIEALAGKGEELKAQSDKTAEANMEAYGRVELEKFKAGTNVVSTNNVQNNQTTKKSIPTRQIPVDAHAHRLALAQ